MTKAAFFGVATATTLLLSACADPPAPPRSPEIKPTEIDGVWYLDQNWKQDARQWYYNTSQGSQIMPYGWFMALEDPVTKAPFAKSLTRFGYLAGTTGSWNPDGLAVGFVKDTDPDKAEWIGFTCAACHTGEVRVNGKTIRIDGGVTTGDLTAFNEGLTAALTATVTDNAAFEAFAKRVLGDKAGIEKRMALLKEVKAFTAFYAEFTKASQPATPWGPMRTDAFGMIFNRVSSIDLRLPKNSAPPDAPVSYPVLWDAPYQPRVQWNGLLANTTSIDALGRNTGEVLGVFGKIQLKKPTSITHYYYDSTVRGRNLIAMENQLRTLRSPLWPSAIAGDVDLIKAEAGEQIYKEQCVSCHAVLPRDKSYDTAPIQMTPLFTWPKPDDAKAVLGAFGVICKDGVDAAVAQGLVSINYAADPKMAVDALCRKVDTGAVAGVAMPPKKLGGTPLTNPALATDLLTNAVEGSIFGQIARDPAIVTDLMGIAGPGPTNWEGAAAQPAGRTSSKVKAVLDTTALVKPNAAMTDQNRKIASILQKVREAHPPAAGTTGSKAASNAASNAQAATDATTAEQNLAATVKSLLAYKARPLDGIWASAPFMHNGSIPNLYEMLLPTAQRSASFRMGSKSIDPVKVGVDQAAADNNFLFDTTKAGNRNTGHEFGATLSDEQRWQVIEYLKTL